MFQYDIYPKMWHDVDIHDSLDLVVCEFEEKLPDQNPSIVDQDVHLADFTLNPASDKSLSSSS